jgi:hypothetical protein
MLFVERCMKEKMVRSCFQKRMLWGQREEKKRAKRRRVNGFEILKVRSHTREVGCEFARSEMENDLISHINSASLEI